MKKVNAKGDLKFIRAENAKEILKKNEITMENDKLKQEIIILKEQIKNNTINSKNRIGKEGIDGDRGNRKRKEKKEKRKFTYNRRIE